MIGFEDQKEYFQALIKNNKLGHAYIFSGPEMIGKKQFAFSLIKMINGQSWQGSSPDVRFIAPRIAENETKIYVEDARDLKNFMSRTPTVGSHKIAIIDDADRLTDDASNTLLKTLEEPSGSALLILISGKEQQLLSTIRSRCEVIRFLPHGREIIKAALKAEKIEREDQELISSLADGRIGWALKISKDIEQVEFVKKQIKDFQKILRQGVAEKIKFAKLIADDERLPDIMDLWLRFSRIYGKDPRKTGAVLHKLLDLYQLTSQPQYNHRLAIENFLLGI